MQTSFTFDTESSFFISENQTGNFPRSICALWIKTTNKFETTLISTCKCKLSVHKLFGV